jgi:DNA polymerase-3 subunit epsilon
MLARQRHPGQRNNLDALCKRYGVDNSGRDLHGALLDAEILAEVYLAMTGGQTNLSLSGDGGDEGNGFVSASAVRRISADRAALAILAPTPEELDAHQQFLARIKKASGIELAWDE